MGGGGGFGQGSRGEKELRESKVGRGGTSVLFVNIPVSEKVHLISSDDNIGKGGKWTSRKEGRTGSHTV